MKKLFILSLVVAFALLGAQAFASPPVKPPIEGFIIETNTEIDCIGDVTESESYSWRYFEGVGMLDPDGRGINTTLGDVVDYLVGWYNSGAAVDPNDGWIPVPAQTQAWIDWAMSHAGNMILLQNLGFAEGAEIVYQQEFSARDGSTFFKKDFKAVSHTDSADEDNLVVDKTINFLNVDKDGNDTTGTATHSEKIGLNVVSVGSAGGGNIAADAASLLSLCPWSTTSDGTQGGYPPTNEGIAAGNEFNVSKINFTSKTKVNSVNNPALWNEVEADGEGSIAAGFVVDLWEGRENDVWGTYAPHQPWIDLYNNMAQIHGLPTWDHPAIVYVQEGPPDLASRTQYEEHASADGSWTFKKTVSYESVMTNTGVAARSNIPINNVP